MYEWLPGDMRIEQGHREDYFHLARFHYCAGPPATFCLVRRIMYRAVGRDHPVVAAVATLSWPTLRCHARERYFNLVGVNDRRRADWLRDHLRTLSRIIVHPRFRGIGLATTLIRSLCRDCPTPHVEAIAAMAAVHPMFERAGMTRLTPSYFIHTRA